MVAPQVFKVLTEFQFETGAAIVNASGLQKSVDGVAQSADSALFSLKRLGFGLVADFGLGASSVLGIFQQALATSEKFKTNQLAVAGLISGNLNNLTGDVNSFADRLEVSKRILKDIAGDARTFGLDEKSLTNTVKLTAAFLIPKGLAGDNFSGARNLSRNFLKSAPTLGVDPSQAQGQLVRAIEGNASLGDTLFRRLNNETDAFQKRLGGAKNAAKAFNKIPLKERFDLITKGLQQFTQDIDVLEENSSTFGSLLRQLGDAFTGLNGILKPLGDTLSGPLKKAFKEILNVIHKDGRVIVQEIANFIKPFMSDLETFVTNLQQLSKVGADLKSASFFATILDGAFAMIAFIGWMRVFRFGMKGLNKTFSFLSTIFRYGVKIFRKLGFVFRFLITSVLRFLPLFAAVFLFFQLISRAIAIAKIKDAKRMPALIARLFVAINKLKDVILLALDPFAQLFESVAQTISPLFQVTNAFSIFISIIEFVAETIMHLFALIQGSFNAIMQTFANISVGRFSGMGESIASSFMEGFQSFIVESQLKSMQNKQKEFAVVNNKIDVGKIEIKNSFKEQYEPDRIAFTIKDQLINAAQNPLGATNKGFAITGSGIGVR